MNKSILKHEMRSMKWMMLLSIIASLFLTIMFSIFLDERYQMMFSSGMRINQAWVQNSLRNVSIMALVAFTGLSIIQVFMQFRAEKNQEIGRFLKSLPVKKDEFFKIKLVTGIINISLGFIVLAIGIIIVRNNNMFWIKDIHNVSIVSAPFMKADGVASLLKEIGLVYLVVLSFYTFLFMVQYTFTNIVGAIVTGILVWLAPMFMAYSLVFTLDTLSSLPEFFYYQIRELIFLLLPWTYTLEYNSTISFTDNYGITVTTISNIENLEIKYIISIVLILANIAIAYKLNKSSKVENENMIIPFKLSKNIFKVGVTLCSGLLVSNILRQVLMIRIHNLIYIGLILIGGFIGYLVSKKIAELGSR